MMMKRKARVLVVDDEIEIVRALQRSLTGHGYEVLIAGKGEQALEIIEHVANPEGWNITRMSASDS